MCVFGYDYFWVDCVYVDFVWVEFECEYVGDCVDCVFCVVVYGVGWWCDVGYDWIDVDDVCVFVEMFDGCLCG